jgi:probable rRNA maturation factor
VNAEILVFNRQRRCRVNLRLVRQAAGLLISRLDLREPSSLGIHLVAAGEMSMINQEFLQHDGSTDVITFDYSERPQKPGSIGKIQGEIFICIDDAIAQAREFRGTWQLEVARYLVHGVLHLCGYDDLSAAPRQKMKREEDRLLQALRRKLKLDQLGSSLPARKRPSRG